MSKQENFMDKARSLWENMQPALHKCGDVLYQVWLTLRMIGRYIYRLRSVFMAIPVGMVAVILALRNMQQLPEEVGINLLETGEFAVMVPRSVAVFGPLAVTALCLLMMFCSRKTLYPWVVSLFSLVLPLLVLFTNIYPA